MALNIVEITREFVYNGIILPDPSPDFSVSMVQDFYSAQYPALTNAVPEDKGIQNDKRVISFNNKVGVKG